MAKSKKQQRQVNAQITMFLDECFEQYSMKYEWFFSEYDGDNKRTVLPLFQDGVISEKILVRAAEILGMTTDEILSQNNEAALRWYKKYPFFAHLLHFHNLRVGSFHGEGFFTAHLIKAIFGENSCDYPEHYDEAAIRTRMIEALKNANGFLPGTFHEGAEILDFRYETEQFFSYPAIREMLESFFDIIARIKALFFKAWKENLDEQEIMEYNFLVTFLDITDVLGCAPVYYAGLKRLVPIYCEEGYKGDEEEFSELVLVNFFRRFKPWACKEFAENADLAQRYVSINPNAKNAMFEYGRLVKYFSCSFKWSDAEIDPYESPEDVFEQLDNMTMEELIRKTDQDIIEFQNYQETVKKTGVGELAGWTHIAVQKSTEELNGDGIYAEKLIRLGGVPSKGGVHITRSRGNSLSGSEHLNRILVHKNVLREASRD